MINQITFDTVPQNIHVDYNDGDIMFIDNMRDLSKHISNDSVTMLDMIMFLICVNGKGQVELNSKTYTLTANCMICCTPNSIIDTCMISADFEAKILCVSTKIIQSLIRIDKNTWNQYFNVMRNPVVEINESGMTLMNYYYSLVKYRLTQVKSPYDKEATSALVSAALYDALGVLDEPNLKLGCNDEAIMQCDHLFRRFVELLSATNPPERSVSYYGKMLCVTPKYLSTTVKKVSGKTALAWITERTVNDIKRLLLHSDLTVKEIADKMNFPNLSFFGKYVKSHLGASPTEYRKMKRPDDEDV